MPAISDTPPDWRTKYEGFERFPRLAFAWEYLRRKDSFREASDAARWRPCMQEGQLQVFRGDRILSACADECLFASSAEKDARSATVFWNPDACPKVLRLLALPERKSAKPFVLAGSALPAVLLLTDDGTQHVLLRDGVSTLQLFIQGESLLRPVTLALDTGMPQTLVPYQERRLSCFHAYRSRQGLPERYFPPDPHAARLTFVLRALDGWRIGATQREIATVLYGRERVERDWRDPRENLRDRVRHAIARGRSLMDHGYRAFLR